VTIIELLDKYPWPDNIGRKEQVIEHLICIPVQSNLLTLWSWLADTSRVNRYLGMAERNEFEENGSLVVETKSLGIPQKWIEHPWRWVRGESIVLDRDYIVGFAKKNHSIFYFENGNIYIYMGFIPSGFFSSLIFKFGLKKIMAKIAHIVLMMDQDAKKGLELPHFFEQNDFKISMYQKQILHQRLKNAISLGLDTQIASRLEKLIIESDELDLFRLKAKEIAYKWQLNEKEIIKSFLLASHCKVFDISWDIICPSCHGPRTESARLIDLLKFDDCSACKISFETNFERAIEVIFKINPDIREIKELKFCAAEPAKKKKIYAQWDIPKDETLTQEVSLNEGSYLVRDTSSVSGLRLNISKTGRLKDAHWQKDKEQTYDVSSTFNIHIENSYSEKKIFVLEKIEVDPFFLQPSEVFSLAEFRNFFKDEKIGNGVQLYLGDQVVLFTDIISSTKLYEKSGDKSAYLQVKSHFDDVFRIFGEQEGVIVKTIGDAVMASFPSPSHALRATKDLHQFFDLKHTHYDFDLRVSAHIGKAIGVNQNTGVDYFGNTVNVSAKLQALANEQQLAVSEVFFNYLRDEDLQDFDIEKTSLKIAGKAEPTRAVRLTLKLSN